MSERVDVAVIGLGVMGRALLAALTRRGARAVGLDRGPGPQPSGPSHADTRGWRAPYWQHPAYLTLIARARDAWLGLGQRHDVALLERSGGLISAPAQDPMIAGPLTTLRAQAWPHELLDAASARARWPRLLFEPAHLTLWDPSAGYLRADLANAALLADARGAHALHRADVLSIKRAGEAWQVITTRGVWRADQLAITTGAGALELGGALRALVPKALSQTLTRMRHVEAWCACEAGEQVPLFQRRVGEADALFGLASGAPQQLKVCARLAPHAVPDDARVRALVARALTVPAEVLRWRVGDDAATPDGAPRFGPHPDEAGVWLALGLSGHGYKLAPAIAEAMAGALAGEREALAGLEHFAPSR